MRRGGAGRAPQMPRGSLGIGGLIVFGGLAAIAINASIFNGIFFSLSLYSIMV